MRHRKDFDPIGADGAYTTRHNVRRSGRFPPQTGKPPEEATGTVAVRLRISIGCFTLDSVKCMNHLIKVNGFSSNLRGIAMIERSDIDDVLKASLYFHELFKKVILTNFPAETLTKTQMDLLMVMYADGPMSMSKLSARVGIAPEQATRAIKNLKEKDLAESDRDENNRRIVIARLSERGMLMLDDHFRDVCANLKANLKGLDDAEFSQLAETARSATRLLDKTSFHHTVTPH